MITKLEQFITEKNKSKKINENIDNISMFSNLEKLSKKIDYVYMLADEGYLDNDLQIREGLNVEDLPVDPTYLFNSMEDFKKFMYDVLLIITHSVDENLLNEGFGSIVSNIVNNDKKMGEVLTKNLQTYISSKPKAFTDDNKQTIDLTQVTPEDLNRAYELGKAANYYTKDIKFENDNQKKAWAYLRQRASKSMHFSSSGNINPAS